MKRIITLLAVALTAQLSIAQVVFQSNLSMWDTAGNPSDFFGVRTSFASADVTQVTVGATYGTSMAKIVNTSSSHRRLTTQSVAVVSGAKYQIDMWVAGLAGELRIAFYDNTNGSYSSYNAYQFIGPLSAGSLVKITDSISIPATCSNVEFILSSRNTDANGFVMDSVAISQIGGGGNPGPPAFYPPKSIYAVQYTTDFSGDSPLRDSLVEVTGIVTGVATGGTKGYFIQDSAAAWNGIFVADQVSVPSRGDKVTVRGQVKENFDNTQIMFIDTMITVSSGNPEPAAIAVTSSTAADEMYEGVLLKVNAAMCVDTVVRFGEWFVAGAGMDTLMVDDLLLSTTYNPVLYQGYDVTGVLFYAFSAFKIEPRDSMDIVQNTTISIIENNLNVDFTVYPNPVNDFFTISGVNLERAEIYTSTGKLVKSLPLNTINTVNVSDLSKGVYVIRVISGDNAGVSRFVKQ